MIKMECQRRYIMKGKIISIFLAAILCASVAACSNEASTESVPETSVTSTSAESVSTSEESSSESEQGTEQETGTVEKINLDNSEGTLTYTNYELTTDYEGNPAILVYYDYTNKKEETSYAQMTFYPQAFQNGVECDLAILMDDNEAYSNASKEITTGTTINVAFAYSLQDTTNPVTIEVTDQSSENLFNDISQQQEIALQ